MKLKESDVTKQIRSVLKACRYPNWKIFQTLGSYRGMSDIIAVQPITGRIVAIEVKTPGWRPPGPKAQTYRHYAEQKSFIDTVTMAGGIGFFATSVEEVIERLELRAKVTPLFGRNHQG
ncbi:MAG: hypothetical protein WC331_10110 [Candidatus Omnitrophota bacterium]|jgi:hypothetical protein